jgi:hypothetical protein
MSMRFSRTLWLWASLAVVALAILLMRFLVPHRVEAPVAGSIPDRSITSPLNQPGGGSVPDEAYEVYSALYATQQPEPLAFAEDSMTDIPQVDGSCLKASTPEQREMTDAFTAANRQSHRWESRFAIPSGYRLFSHAEAALAQRCIQSHVATADCASYARLRHVRFLGLPGFDHSHTRALVSVIKMCGGDCGSGGIFEVEKRGTTWQRADSSDFTRNCSWMY